jgi:hypothetical protein
MNTHRLPAALAASAFLCLLTVPPAAAQPQNPPSFTRTVCLKVTDANTPVMERLLTEANAKVGLVGLQKGFYNSVTVSRAVYPQGAAASCNYIVSWNYAGLPPEITKKMSDDMFQAAGMGTWDAFLGKLSAASELVRTDLWSVIARAGTMRTGDYFRLNWMRVKPGKAAEWGELETKQWAPVMEARVADGELRGWVSYNHVLPAGADQTFNAATVDVFPSWDKMWRQKGLGGYVAKVHPGLNAALFNSRTNDAREMARVEVYQVVSTQRK